MNLKQLKAKLRGIVAKLREHIEAGTTGEQAYKDLKTEADNIKAQIAALEELEEYDEAGVESQQLVGSNAQNGQQNGQSRNGNGNSQSQNNGGEEETDAQMRQRMLAANNPPQPSRNLAGGNGVQNGFSESERRALDQFRIVDYCREAADIVRGTQNGLSGLNKEIHQEARNEARASGIEIRGVGVPHRMLNYRTRNVGPVNLRRVSSMAGQFVPRNDLIAETDSQGGHTIATELMSPIDILRERLRVREMGATIITGLEGNVDFPKWAAGSDPSEKGENVAADEYSPTLSKFTLSPERLPVFTEVSTQLLAQSSIDVEAYLRFELGFRLATVMDKRAINGSGSNDEPTGVLSASGVNVVAIGTDGGAMTRDHIVDMETAIAEDNADEMVMGFLTTPGVRGHLKKVKVDTGSGEFVWPRGSGSRELEGYRAAVSTNVPSNLTKGAGTDLHAMIFGVWSNMIIGQWGGIDIVVNPFSRDTEGLVRITFTVFYDIGFRHGEGFAVIKDIDIS